MKPQESWRSGKTSAQRGYGYKWQKARLQYLQLHPLCRKCDERGRVVSATVVDHRIPHRGDLTLFWDSENWQGLCAPCHDGEKKREEAGHINQEIGVDGWPLTK